MAKKTPAKKKPAKKTPAKKTPAKKKPAKKIPAKKTPAKKKPAKKTPAKKTPVKKTPASKDTPKIQALVKKENIKKAPDKETAVMKPVEQMTIEELKKLTISQLKEICKEKGYKVLTRYNKDDFIQLIISGGVVKKTPAKRKPGASKPSAKKKDTGTIVQGTIAGFMRKRTQLVGFEYGYNKHTQYCAEFIDNALDAIESFQWKQIAKEGPYQFTLDQELSIENLSILQAEDKHEEEKAKPLDDEAKHSLRIEFGLEPIEPEKIAKIEIFHVEIK